MAAGVERWLRAPLEHPHLDALPPAERAEHLLCADLKISSEAVFKATHTVGFYLILKS